MAGFFLHNLIDHRRSTLALDKHVNVCPENYSRSVVISVLKCLSGTVQKVKAVYGEVVWEHNLCICSFKSERK